MGVEVALAVATTAAVAGGTYYQKRQGDKAERAAEEARDKESRMNELQNAKSRRQAIAQSRIESARIRNLAAGQGASGSSAVAGGTGAIQSDTAGNIGMQQALTDLNNARLDDLSDVAGHRQNAQVAGQLTGAVSSIASLPTFGKGGTGGGTGGGTSSPAPSPPAKTFAAPRAVPGSGAPQVRKIF